MIRLRFWQKNDDGESSTIIAFKHTSLTAEIRL